MFCTFLRLVFVVIAFEKLRNHSTSYIISNHMGLDQIYLNKIIYLYYAWI